ncbi:hypothetical protein Sango_2810700 [Sesamum angolense]|uniref:Tf2-1-like SH3-like domain-containing protein n=1 Tax=Sesamum angolense TaxID=2727404 RepID=A0AAE1T6V3_9LAMI|nr:hypothetical protein Sango_2810700 [Sesamum angolense]
MGQTSRSPSVSSGRGGPNSMGFGGRQGPTRYSVEDLFLLVPTAVGNTLVNVGELSQLSVIVAINQDILLYLFIYIARFCIPCACYYRIIMCIYTCWWGYVSYYSGEILSDVPIVREFPDVFPEELPGLPPHREVDFEIDTILGAAPISIYFPFLGKLAKGFRNEIAFEGNWDDHLPLMEFAYNNSFQSSIGMAPYEALYGRKCRSPICWDIEGLRQLEGPELVQQTVDKIQTVKKCLKAAQDRQKSYADKYRREMEYEVGEKVFLKVSPWRGILRFGKQEKLSPRYIGPDEILERVGPLAYRLALPTELSQIHDVFHVSMLRRYDLILVIFCVNRR